MEIFQTFGLNPYLTIAQIVNFLILLYILKKFLYPPIFKVFKKREELVKESIAKAEKSQKALDEALDKEKIIVKEARTTANQILADAEEQASQIIEQAQEIAKKQTEKMVADAKEQIERETRSSEARLTRNITELSIDILKKSLSGVFTDSDQESIINRTVKVIEKRPD